MPFQLAGAGVQNGRAIAVEIVTLAFVAVVIGSGISGAPLNQIQRRIVGTGKPGGRAAVLP